MTIITINRDDFTPFQYDRLIGEDDPSDQLADEGQGHGVFGVTTIVR